MMGWRKPDDLELVAECESLPEIEVIRGLLAGSGIESTVFTSSQAAKMFAHKSILGTIENSKPYKLLVRPEDAETAKELISATPLEPANDTDMTESDE